MNRAVALTLALLLLDASQLQAQANPFALGADARPRVASGKIVTDAFVDATGQLEPNVRTFGWQFQTIPGDPYFLQDPGFNAVSGSGLPGGSALGFNVTRHLAYWPGAGTVDFTAPIPNGETLTFNFGAGTVTIAANSPPQPGFNFATVSASGGTHRHLNAYLNAAAGTPTDGVYFASIRLTNTGGPAPSDPLFLLFGNGVPVTDLQRALGYVANPFPGDANYSGRVDIADFSTLAAKFNEPGFWYDGDFNGDLLVNIADFSLLAANFNQSAPAARVPTAGAAVVPEPAAFAGLAIAGWACLSRRRWR